MLDKKGGMALPLYLSVAMAALVIILVIFGIFFFVTGIKQNPKLVISSAAYQDSTKLLVILKSKVITSINDQNPTIAELISLAAKDQNYKKNLTSELSFLISKLPQPKTGKNLAETTFVTPTAVKESLKEANWVSEIYINEDLFLKTNEETLLGTKYLEQTASIPLENKKIAIINLYLDCIACSQEDINVIT